MRPSRYVDLVQKMTKYVNTLLRAVEAPTSRPLTGPLLLLSLRQPHSRQSLWKLMILRQVVLSRIPRPMSLFKLLTCPGLAPSRTLTALCQCH